MHYSTLLIDLDHTLFDSDASETAALRQAMAVADIADPETHAADFRRINLELWARVERGEMTPQQVRIRRFERLVEETRLDADPFAMSDAYVVGLGASGELYDGAREVLESLRRHASLALLTNGLSEVQRARIKRTAIGEYFDAIIISAEVGASKPAARIFDIAFGKLGSPGKDTALMVGDNLVSDIGGGANYGIATCWYNPRQLQAGPDHRVHHEIASLGELSKFVGRKTAVVSK